MKIEKEYFAQAIDPKTKVVKYQSASKFKGDLERWFKSHAQSGKFAGLEPHIQYRYLINGKPFHVEQKHILWATIIVLAAFNIWMVAHS